MKEYGEQPLRGGVEQGAEERNGIERGGLPHRFFATPLFELAHQTHQGVREVSGRFARRLLKRMKQE
eukprot:401206-Amphidinium_carterae.1